VGLLAGVLATACGTADPTAPALTDTRATVGEGRGAGIPAEAGSGEVRDWFLDRADAAGLDFVHFHGGSGDFYFPEIMGPGIGLLDYDNDGDLDVFVVQGRMLGKGEAPGGAPAGLLPGGQMYRNDLQARGGDPPILRFTRVTGQSGIDARGYGMGVAAGDYNNDGCVDLYLANYGPNQLLRNRCDGTFADESRRSRTDDPGFSVSAAFVDYDRDGWLDLYVGNYVHYSIEGDIPCISVTGGRDYCPPQTYPAQHDRLYRNQKNGTFLDVSAEALIGRAARPALGVATADVNGDGWMDVYVANDKEENQLWLNQRDGTFRDAAPFAGVAVNRDGKAEASMGVDAGDFDNDGDEDFFLTHLTGETNTLYVNDGTGLFEDRSASSGLAAPSLPYTGFGTAWLDFDNDGWLDVLTVNGTVARQPEPEAGDPFPYRQRMQLFRNLGAGRFEEITRRAGAVFESSSAGRGAAFGDIDNDGDTDAVAASANGPIRLLVNQGAPRHHWLGLRLIGGDGMARDMLGARVRILRRDGRALWRRVRADGSYASANDPRLLIGLGDSAEPPDLRVQWPSGRVEEWAQLPTDRWATLREGSGR
jgi:hypothetical protein